MSPSLEAQIADHSARIRVLEEQRDETRQDHRALAEKFDRMQWWLIGILGAMALQLAVLLLKK